ncbi:hypothetical protein B0E53_00859 [Micromonospora sp. MH33]|nr:hypothetical protein B0E53_00859 [Micromonospora sp. MH33]
MTTKVHREHACGHRYVPVTDYSDPLAWLYWQLADDLANHGTKVAVAETFVAAHDCVVAWAHSRNGHHFITDTLFRLN